MRAIRLAPALVVVLVVPLTLVAAFRTANADHWRLEPAVPVEATNASCGGAAGGTVCRYSLARHLTLAPTATCSDVTLLATSDSLGDIVWFYDRAGQLAFESTIFSWTGAIKNPLTGESVAYDGQGMTTTDFVEGIGSYSYLIYVPAGDIIASIRGDFAFDPATLATLADYPDGQDAFATQICSLLPTDPDLMAPQPDQLGQPY